MNGLDVGTVLVSYLIGSALCALVMFSLWQKNRRQPGISLWMADFGLQFAGLLLVVLRGAIPDFLSIVVANLFIIGGSLALLMGLERYTDRGSSQRYNYLYLAALMGVQVYFAFVQPSLQARNVNISLGLLVICSQGVWLLLRRVDAATRRDGRPVAYVLVGFTLLSAVRILAELATPVGSTHFQSGLYDTLIILIYQMLHFSLTFALILMVNRRLQHNLKDELAERAAAAAARRASEEKFKAIVEYSTSAEAWISPTGTLIWLNPAALQMTGYTLDELVAVHDHVALLIAEADRPAIYELASAARQAGNTVQNLEVRARRKDGALFWVSLSWRPIFDAENRWQGIRVSAQDITERKEIEATLRQSEARYRLLAENMVDVVWAMNPAGQFTYVSPSVLQLRGYTPEEVMQQSPEEAVCPGSLAALQAGMAQAFHTLHTGERLPPVYFQIEQPCKDGSTVWTEATGRVMYDELQRPVGIVGVTRDISERRKTEETLRISEARHRLIAENTRDVIWVMGLDGSMVYTSPSVEQMRGLTPTEAQLQPLEQILTPASRAIVQAYFQKLWGAVEAGLPLASFRGELEYYHKDGSTIWTEVMAFPIPSPSGGFVEILGVTRDIRERRQAEEALRQSEAKFRALADTSPLAIYMSTGIEEKAEYVNATFVRLFGYTMAEVPTAAHWWPRAYPDAPYRQQIAEEWQRRIEQAIATQSEIEPLEVVVTCKDGSLKNILWGFKTIGAQNWSFGLDLTERKRAEAALAEAKEAAEAANRAKSQFLANMSHELRTPLNAILGFSEIMAQDANLSADQQENLAIINRSGDHLLGLISDVLDMAKIEAGRSTVQAQDFDLAQLLADIKELFGARAARKGLVLQVVSAPDMPHFVHADAGKLRQVLINLLGNAIKFTAVGSVELAVAPVDPVTPGADSRLRFTVRDTGPGIAAENLIAIFEPFVQVANGQTVHEGTGLGLPISRQFARLLGGDLTASSAGVPGQGSQFMLEIPVGVLADAAPVAHTAALRRLHLAPDQPVYRLLVAEDRPESRKLLADLLTRLGFSVRTAENGQQALAVWAEWQPHLVWMDMRMPVMDGREATRRIKATAQGQHTVVIGVSAGVLGDQQAAVLADGCDDFVAKPFQQAAIVHCLVKHLGVRMVYTEGQPVAQPAAAHTSPLPAWADAPARWCAQVQQAATAADAEQLRQLAAALAAEQPALAAALQASVDAFDYGAILDAVADIRKDI